MGEHAPSYWSYFMAKLFREKNNSISARYRVTVLPSSTGSPPCGLGTPIEETGERADRLSLSALDIGEAPIIAWKIKTCLVGRKLIPSSLFRRVLPYETAVNKLFTPHGRFLRRESLLFLLFSFFPLTSSGRQVMTYALLKRNFEARVERRHNRNANFKLEETPRKYFEFTYHSERWLF